MLNPPWYAAQASIFSAECVGLQLNQDWVSALCTAGPAMLRHVSLTLQTLSCHRTDGVQVALKRRGRVAIVGPLKCDLHPSAVYSVQRCTFRPSTGGVDLRLPGSMHEGSPLELLERFMTSQNIIMAELRLASPWCPSAELAEVSLTFVTSPILDFKVCVFRRASRSRLWSSRLGCSGVIAVGKVTLSCIIWNGWTLTH